MSVTVTIPTNKYVIKEKFTEADKEEIYNMFRIYADTAIDSVLQQRESGNAK